MNVDIASVAGIRATLVKRGCPDLTLSMDRKNCSKVPVAGGGFCDVYKGLLLDGSVVAIKLLRIFGDPNGGSNVDSRKELKRVARELYHWSNLQHPNVLPLMGLSMFQGRIAMISQWVDGGNLPQYLSRYPNVDRIALCVGICEGLCYIHGGGMVHGDIKGANIMVSIDGIAMIGDFGNSSMKDLTLNITNTTKPCISLRWTAPELVRSDKATTNKKTDVYAYGMTVLEVMSGKVPYADVKDARVLALLTAGERPPRTRKIDNHLWGILLQCWAQKPAERPTAKSLLTLMHQCETKRPRQGVARTRFAAIKSLAHAAITIFRTDRAQRQKNLKLGRRGTPSPPAARQGIDESHRSPTISTSATLRNMHKAFANGNTEPAPKQQEHDNVGQAGHSGPVLPADPAVEDPGLHSLRKAGSRKAVQAHSRGGVVGEGESRGNLVTFQGPKPRHTSEGAREEAKRAGIETTRIRDAALSLRDNSAARIELPRKKTPYGPSWGSGPAHIVGDLRGELAKLRALELGERPTPRRGLAPPLSDDWSHYGLARSDRATVADSPWPPTSSLEECTSGVVEEDGEDGEGALSMDMEEGRADSARVHIHAIH